MRGQAPLTLPGILLQFPHPVRGRGSRRAPCVFSRAGAQQELRPPVMALKPGSSSTQAACVAPAPSRSRLVVDRVMRGAALPRGPRENQGRLHPSPPTPLPFQGRGVPGDDLGLKPELHRLQLTRVQAPSHSCSFVFIRGSQTPLHSCPFVVPKHPSIRVHSWFKNTPPFVFIRGSKQRNPRAPSPLTPGPSPLPGARGASGDLPCDKTHRMLPSPRAGCSGLLGWRGVCVLTRGHRGRGGEKCEGVFRRHARDRPGASVLAVMRCDAEGQGLSWRVGTVFGRMCRE